MVLRASVYPEYALAVLLAVAVVLFFPVTRNILDPRDRRKYYQLQALMVIGAVIGAKLAVLFGESGWPFRPTRADWLDVLVSGRSILGALIFGFLAAEAGKRLLGYTLPPNDRFAAVLPFSFAIGRVGCLLHGCCRGTPYGGWCAITYSDGIPRHPAAAYEMAFLLAVGVLFMFLVRTHLLQGRLFALYLALYGVFRFCSEYVRETPRIAGNLSGYQLLSLVCVALGGIGLWWRTRATVSKARDQLDAASGFAVRAGTNVMSGAADA
jgi:phosphatidylglycerol:prolipoprotein diacylglycerol transferase